MGNFSNTSVISFPRSPQPIYTTIFASENFARLCCVTVLPAPKGPGIAATPPFATGYKASKILCPVMSGSSGVNFSLTFLGILTGHS